MKIGLNFATDIYHYTPEEQIAVAQKAEECGFNSIWTADHLVLAAQMPLRDMARPDQPLHLVDPKSPTARVILPPDEPFPDVWVTFAWLAAATKKLEFGTAIYLAALRHPMVSARAIGTLDYLSRGRVKVGVGVGWLPHEFDLVGVDFATRGRRTNEYVEIIRKLWNEKEPSHQGEFHSFGPTRMEPRPFTPGGPPIMIGGETDIAFRRAARIGDGWCGRFHTPDSLKAALAKINAHRREFGTEKNRFIVQTWVKHDTDEATVRALGDAGSDEVLVQLHESLPTAAKALAWLERASERFGAHRINAG